MKSKRDFVRRECLISQVQFAKLEGLRKSQGNLSASAIVRRAIDAYEPCISPEEDEAVLAVLERAEKMISATREERS